MNYLEALANEDKDAATKAFAEMLQDKVADALEVGKVEIASTILASEEEVVSEENLKEGGPTRKHFQQVADLIKEIPDENKRKELAKHHAEIFKSQNPRFDHSRFYKAAGVTEGTLSPGSNPTAPTNAQLNKNVLSNIRKATQVLRLKGVNPVTAAAAHRDFGKLISKNPKAPGYMLLRKLAANKAAQVQSLSQAGVPLGQSLEAPPNDFNQAIQRIKRFK